MNYKKKIFLFGCRSIILAVVGLGFLNSVYAAESDSIKVKIKTQYTNIKLLDIRQDTLRSIDSNLDFFHQYNPALRFDHFCRDLGFIGSATTSLNISTPAHIGFDAGLHQFDPYMTDKDNVLFYNTHTPYSEFFYTQGAKAVQLFNALHSRNISPNWNISIFFKNLASDGFSLDTKAKHRIFGATTWLHSKNYRYALYMSAIKNSIKSYENGGIANDSLYETLTPTEKQNALYRLSNARQDVTVREYSLTQILNLGKADTNRIKAEKFPYKNQFYFRNNISYRQQEYTYYSDLSTDTSYYRKIYDSNSTKDGIKWSIFENDFSFNANSGKVRKDGYKDFNFKPGIKFQQISLVKDSTVDSVFQNVSFNFVLDKYFYFSRLYAEGNYIFMGPDAGNMYALGYLKFFLPFDFVLKPGLSETVKSASYLEQNAHTNYFRWNNNFNPMNTVNLFAGLSNDKFRFDLDASYFLINDYIYFDENIIPVQLSKPISYFAVELKKDFKLGKFHFDNHGIYQQELSNENVLHLPAWIFYNSTYYENNFFKNALLLRLGFDVRLQDEYYADYYYAPYSIFYHQNEMKVKTYPVFDLYLGATIKRMRIFIKYEHFNQDLFPSFVSYNFPHYPTDPRVIRFGFSWLFFD